jgi:hypothetical protein
MSFIGLPLPEKHDWTLHWGDWSLGILEWDVESDAFHRTTVFLGPPDWSFRTAFSAEAVVAIFAATVLVLIAGVSFVITKYGRSRQGRDG